MKSNCSSTCALLRVCVCVCQFLLGWTKPQNRVVIATPPFASTWIAMSEAECQIKVITLKEPIQQVCVCVVFYLSFASPLSFCIPLSISHRWSQSGQTCSLLS